MIAVVLSGLALGAGLGDGLGDLVARHGSAGVAIACAPAGQLIERLGGLPPLAAQAEGGPFSALRSPEQAAAMGFDLSGTLGAAIAVPSASGWLSLPFTGGAAQAEDALRSLAMEPEQTSESVWALRGGNTMASLDQRELMVQVGGRPSGILPDRALLDGFPAGGGCLIWFDAPEELGATQKLGDMQAAAWFPLAPGAETLMRFKLDAPAPEALARPTAAPVGGSSSEAPTLLFAVGVSLESLLDDPLVASALDLKGRDARRAARAFDMGAGATFAVFGDPDPSALDWVAVIPSERRHKPRAIARRARRALHRLELEVERTSPTTFVARREQTTLYGASTDGRLILGHDPMRVGEAASGAGRSWLEGARLERLQGWAISVWTGPGLENFPDLPQGFSADIGIRSREGVWELGLHMEGERDLFDLLFNRGELSLPGEGMRPPLPLPGLD